MRKSSISAIVIVLTICAQGILAQTVPTGLSWVQIAAHPDKSQALERIGNYTKNFGNIVGYEIGGGWYGIALGPYTRTFAENAVKEYTGAGLIPENSFVTNGTSYQVQYYPLKNTEPMQAVAPKTTELDNLVTTGPQIVQVESNEDAPITFVVAEVEPERPEEQFARAQSSERSMSRKQKQILQKALASSGHYTGKIDGLYGPGTRGAMTLWQTENGFVATGVLTAMQRESALNVYNAFLADMGFDTAFDLRSGISLEVPKNILASAQYDAPFIRFESKNLIDARLILISQTGGQARLIALFDVLQTLELFPTNGSKELRKSGFKFEGETDLYYISGFARLNAGEIKGAILVWPLERGTDHQRVKDEIFGSFKRIWGVLEDPENLNTNVSPTDYLAGLELKQPSLSRSGVFVDQQATVITARDDLDTCTNIKLGDGSDLRIAAKTDDLIALRPTTQRAPSTIARLQNSPIQVPQPIVIGGYSYAGALGAPTISLGSVQSLVDLEGRNGVMRLQVNTLLGDIGGPVFDKTGALIAILLPSRALANKQLPSGVHFAASTQISKLMQVVGVTSKPATNLKKINAVALSILALETVALVQCWD